MVLAFLSLAVAAGLALFAAALARPAPLPGRPALLALLGVLFVLVLRGAALQLGWWNRGAVELAITLGLFVSVPLLVSAFARDVLRPESKPAPAAGRYALPVAVAVAAGAWMLQAGTAWLPSPGWPAFVALLWIVSLVQARAVWSLWSGSARPAWLPSVLGLFAVHWSFSLAGSTVDAAGIASDGLVTLLEAGSLLSLLAFGAVAVVRALRHLPALQPPASAPYAGSGLDDALCRQRADALREHMRTARPHLDPELGAADLAEALGLTPRELSQVLNVEIGQGFFEFVNAHRTDEAKRLLASPDHAGTTVLEILYASGFNSKSAFHRAFKANVGATPSAYRRRQLDGYAQAA